MRKVRIEDAIGLPIGHDMTKVEVGKFKGALFKKGHIISEDDIPKLKEIGKEHVYIDDIPEGYLHEDECAVRIAKAICDSEDFVLTDVSEGKVLAIAKYKGLLKINEEMLLRLNNIEDIAISTLYNEIVVLPGQPVMGERIIPLYTKKQNIEQLEEICKDSKPISISKFHNQKVHLVITGSEVYKGLVKDRFFDTLKPKVESYGCELVKAVKVPDDKLMIKNAINERIEEGADIVICTGGMSVDEDDITPVAIKEVVDKLIVHGIPVQPGNMFLLGYKGDIPVMGIPGAVIYYPTTIFDITFPRLACGERLEKQFFTKLFLGGLCYFCSKCSYPNCTFGKGR